MFQPHKKIWIEYLPNEVTRCILQDWLYVRDILHLDVAMTNRNSRKTWMEIMKCVISPTYYRKFRLMNAGVILPLENGNIVTGSALQIINPSSGSVLTSLHSEYTRVVCMTALPNKQLAIGTFLGDLVLCALGEDSCSPLITCNILSSLFSPTFLSTLSDGRLFAYAADDFLLQLWNIENRELEGEFTVQMISLFTRGGHDFIACDGAEYEVEIRSISNIDETSLSLSGHTSFVYTVISLSDGRLATGSGDISIKIWDFNSGICEQTFKCNIGYVTCLLQISNTRLAAGGTSVCIWNIVTGQCERVIGGTSEVRSLFLLKDRSLATTSERLVLEVWAPTW